MSYEDGHKQEITAMRTFKVIIVLAALALTGALTLSSAWAQEATETPPPGTAQPVEMVQTNGDIKIKLNFQQTPLQAVLEYLSETAGLTVISDQPLMDGTMTVISRQPISLDEAVSLINSMLKEKGLTTVLRGKTLKVVTLEKAKLENLPVHSGRDPNAIVAGDDVVTYVVPVGHVAASALKENLQSLVPEYASLEANEDGNALIITDTTANIKRLVQIVRALDTHMSMVAEIRVFRLTSADATSAATLINNIFEQEQSGGASSRQRGGFNPMEMMMRRMGRGRGGPGGDDNGGGGSGSAGGSASVKIVATADERTNSVVVRGPGEALTLVEDLIKSLDDTTVEVAGVRVFQLRYADATNVADVINTLFGDEQSSSQSDRGGPMMFRGPFGRGGPGGQQDSQQDDTNSKLSVTAAADSQTNTVVVTGPDKILEIVTQVVEKLDTQLPNVADVKVFHLEYADAQDTAELINEVFGESSSSSSRNSRNQQNQQTRFMRGGPPMNTGGDTGSGSSDVTVVAAADSLTNSVVVSGAPETLKIIADVIKELDENPEQERQIFVYPLKNAGAENIMEILNNLFEELQALNQQGTGTTGQQFQGGQRGAQPAAGGGSTTSSSASGGANDLDEETYFEADTDTNSLLVLTSTKNYAKIKPILDELDKPIGQVLIKVLFAEITHNNDVDLGAEFSAWNLRGASDDLNIDLGTTFGQPLTGFSATVFDQDVEVAVHALQETGKLNILSRPYILTSNNQEATITVGQEVPYATGESLTTGQSQTTTEYRDIGIILSVTPSINPDGLVNMTVRPEISSQTGETVQISENLSLPVFSTRTSETKVAIRDGQTIVIGGLIQDQTTETVSKVPLLGDIPIVGNLFRRTQKGTDKTELLIFLTPHVAPDALALTPISDTERSRSNLLKDEAVADLFRKHMDGMKGPDGSASEPNEP